MRIRNYDENDYVSLCSWLDARGIKRWTKEHAPKIGYVVCEGSEPVVIGFLRMVEGGSAMLDGLCSNPSINPYRRNDAIDMVVKELIKKAKDLGLSGILSFSEDRNTLERSARFGFEKKDSQKMIVLNLGE